MEPKRLLCQYGNYSGGAALFRLTVRIDRTEFGNGSRGQLEEADRLFSDTKITGEMCFDEGGGSDVRGQVTLGNTNADEIVEPITAEVASFHPVDKRIDISLVMSRECMNMDDFCNFAGRKGQLIINNVEARERRPRGRPKSETRMSRRANATPNLKRSSTPTV